MAVLCGPDDVQDGHDVRPAPQVVTYGYMEVSSPEAVAWLSECCGLRWQNMAPLELASANSLHFLPYVEKGGNPVEDATVCPRIE